MTNHLEQSYLYHVLRMRTSYTTATIVAKKIKPCKCMTYIAQERSLFVVLFSGFVKTPLLNAQGFNVPAPIKVNVVALALLKVNHFPYVCALRNMH